jgi:hypothetical protein
MLQSLYLFLNLYNQLQMSAINLENMHDEIVTYF